MPILRLAEKTLRRCIVRRASFIDHASPVVMNASGVKLKVHRGINRTVPADRFRATVVHVNRDYLADFSVNDSFPCVGCSPVWVVLRGRDDCVVFESVGVPI